MNFPPPVDPDNLGRGPAVVGLSWAFTIVAIVVVGLRMYVRKTLTKSIASDDWLMCLALAFHIVSVAFVSVSYHYGMGKHDHSLTPTEMVNVLKWMWMANTPGLLVSITARVSIAILLVRLFGVYTWLKWFVIATTGVCSIMTLIILPCTYLQSTPVSGNWDIFNPNVTHWDPNIYINIAFTSQAFWTFSDLTLVLFPVMVVWRLNMPLRQRLGLMILLAVSLFTMVMSILKTVGLKAIADQQADPKATDVQYNATLSILYTCLEQACVIIMGCVPPLRAIMKLEPARSVSSSLASLLRRGKSSQASGPSFGRDYKTQNSDSGPASLEMHTDKLGRVGGNKGLSFAAATVTAGGENDSQRDLVKGSGGIFQTSEMRVSYSNSSRGSDKMV